jgi:hypothetical protein
MGVCEYEWARGKEIGMKDEKNKDEGGRMKDEGYEKTKVY